MEELIDELQGIDGQEKLVESLRLYVLKDSYATPESYKNPNSPNFRSWTIPPYLPDPSHEDEISKQLLATMSVGHRQIVRLFEAPCQQGFNQSLVIIEAAYPKRCCIPGPKSREVVNYHS